MGRKYAVTRKRNKIAKSARAREQRKRFQENIENPTEFVPKDAHLEYYNVQQPTTSKNEHTAVKIECDPTVSVTESELHFGDEVVKVKEEDVEPTTPDEPTTAVYKIEFIEVPNDSEYYGDSTSIPEKEHVTPSNQPTKRKRTEVDKSIQNLTENGVVSATNSSMPEKEHETATNQPTHNQTTKQKSTKDDKNIENITENGVVSATNSIKGEKTPMDAVDGFVVFVTESLKRLPPDIQNDAIFEIHQIIRNKLKYCQK